MTAKSEQALRQGTSRAKASANSVEPSRDSGQAKRTERARQGRWAVARVEANTYHVVNLDNGGHCYKVATLGNDGYTCTCKDREIHPDLRCKHGEVIRLLLAGESLNVRPIVKTDEAGITATFFDGAAISLTIGGRSACSKCGEQPCDHYYQAVPHYARWKWQQAQSGRWPANRLAELGIPPIAVRPELIGEPWWTPAAVAVDGAKVYAVAKGHVVRFQDGGHVFVGGLHPDGHTPCLGSDDGCKAGTCDHVARAFVLAQARAIHLCGAVSDTGEGTATQRPMVSHRTTSPLTHNAEVGGTSVVSPDQASNPNPHHITEKGRHTMSNNGNARNGRLVEIMAALAEPFPPQLVKWKPQVLNKDKTKGMAVVYADARAYEDRLNTVCPEEWSVTFQPWGENQIICHLTIVGITRSSTGEAEPGDANTGTSAEQQAFKRACAKFKLGRYFYNLPKFWMSVVKQGRSYVFTDEALAQLRHFLATGELPNRQRRQKTPARPGPAPTVETPGGNGAGDSGNNGSNLSSRTASSRYGVPARGSGRGGMTADQARVFVMPFGTREHPEYKGQKLGDLAETAPDLVQWLAGNEYQPKTESGRSVKAAAAALAKAA